MLSENKLALQGLIIIIEIESLLKTDLVFEVEHVYNEIHNYGILKIVSYNLYLRHRSVSIRLVYILNLVAMPS